MSASPREKDPRAPTNAELARPRRRGRRPRLDLWAVAFSAVLAMSALLVPPAQAEPVPAGHQVLRATSGASCTNATCDLQATLTNVQYFLIGIAVFLAGIAFAIYGIQHMLGSLEEMDPNKKAQRKKQFLSIVVGLVVVLMSVVLVSVAQGLVVG